MTEDKYKAIRRDALEGVVNPVDVVALCDAIATLRAALSAAHQSNGELRAQAEHGEPVARVERAL